MFVCKMIKSPTEIGKYRDGDSEEQRFINQAGLLRFLVETDFSGCEEVIVYEVVEKEIVKIKL